MHVRRRIHACHLDLVYSLQNSVAENIRNTLGTHWEHIGNTSAASLQNTREEYFSEYMKRL